MLLCFITRKIGAQKQKAPYFGLYILAVYYTPGVLLSSTTSSTQKKEEHGETCIAAIILFYIKHTT